MASHPFMYYEKYCKDGVREAVSKETTVILLLAAAPKLPARVLEAQLNRMITMNKFPSPSISQAVFYAFM